MVSLGMASKPLLSEEVDFGMKSKERKPILEEQGMSVEDLDYDLATGEGVQTLDREMVRMISKAYDVEVLDTDSVQVEEMAKKKEIVDEEDLDKLEDMPPVITIMCHLDHGKIDHSSGLYQKQQGCSFRSRRNYTRNWCI